MPLQVQRQQQSRERAGSDVDQLETADEVAACQRRKCRGEKRRPDAVNPRERSGNRLPLCDLLRSVQVEHTIIAVDVILRLKGDAPQADEREYERDEGDFEALS